MLIKLTKPDFIFENSAGSLKQLIRAGYKQVNVIFSNSGSIRGGHYHKLNDEAFYVINGAFKLSVSKEGMREEYEFKEGDMFIIPPMVSHTFEYTEDTLLVSMYSRGVELDDGTKDIITDNSL